MRRGKDVRTECPTYLSVQWCTPVAGVTHRNLRVRIHELRDGSAVMHSGRRKDIGAELTVIIYAGM